MAPPLWIFAYGSLVWRPAFPFAERHAAVLRGFVRRFWQGSTDHRGVPGAPGRVVTLYPEPSASCPGVAYRVAQDDVDAVLASLDHRERGGYERRDVEIALACGTPVTGLTYVATPDNPNYLGPASLDSIAAQIACARGPSGSNAEYVLALARELRALSLDDPHVFELAELVRARGSVGAAL